MSMKLLSIVIILLASAISALIGIFICLKPAAAINLQIKFYRLINWHIEPISMQKEIRNTKIMGWFMVLVSMAAIGYIFVKDL